MTLTVHLVRHGQTMFNVRGLVQGWVDSPLTEIGVEQARNVGLALAGRPLVGVYSSTSERAEDTAAAIADHHRDLVVTRSKGLKEMYFGELEARSDEEFEAALDVSEFFVDMFAGRSPGFPGGESGAAFVRRVSAAFTSILNAHPDGGEVAVVSHGVTINMILVASGWTSPGPLENASISIVRVTPHGQREVLAVGIPRIPEALLPRRPAP